MDALMSIMLSLTDYTNDRAIWSFAAVYSQADKAVLAQNFRKLIRQTCAFLTNYVRK